MATPEKKKQQAPRAVAARNKKISLACGFLGLLLLCVWLFWLLRKNENPQAATAPAPETSAVAARPPDILKHSPAPSLFPEGPFPDRPQRARPEGLSPDVFQTGGLPARHLLSFGDPACPWPTPAGFLLAGSLLLICAWLLHEKNKKINALAVAVAQARERVEDEAAGRVRTETSLQGIRQELQQIFNSAPFTISIIDTEMRVLRLNPAMESLVGIKSETARGRHCYDLWGQYSDEESRQGVERICDDCLARQAMVDGKSHKYLRKMAGGKIVEIVSSPVRNEHGDIVGAMEVSGDVSEREMAMQALRDSEADYRTLFECSPCVIGLVDFSGIKEYLDRLPREAAANDEAFWRSNPQEVAACLARLRIHEVNRVALRVFGAASQQEFIDGLFRIIGPETAPYLVEALGAMGNGGTFQEHEIVLYRLTGGKIYGIIRWSVVPGHEKNYRRCLVSFSDLTARKEAEERLAGNQAQLRRLSRRLVEVEEADRRHIARELHDKLGQQLTSLGINLHLLKTSGLIEPDSPLARRLHDSLCLTEEMTQQVRDIMADLRPPVLDDYGLGAALRWHGEIFSRRTGIAVRINAADLPRFLPALELTLFRVAQEALTNVAKHAAASEVEIYCRAEAGLLLLEITDNGMGIALSGGNKNAGFGLMSMRERLESFGGELRVDSPPDTGVSVRAKVKI